MNRNLHVDQILQEAETFCTEEKLAESTVIGRIGCLARVLKDISSLNANEIKNWLENYISPRTGQHLGPHGKNAYITSLRWLLKRTKLVPNAEEIMHQLKRIPVKSKGTCISEEDMESILQFSPTMVHDLAYRLIFECGFRPHELLSIRVSDIRKTGSGYKNGNNETDRYDNGDISTKDAIALVNLPDANPVTPSRKNKTGGRVVPVIQNAEPLLRLAIEVEKTNGGMGRLFPWAHKHLSVTFCRMKSQFIDEKSREMNSEIGNLEKQNDLDTNSIQSLDTAFKMTKPHNISVSFRLYDFRHTAITNLYLTTLSDQIIRKMVGWTPSSKMPDVYVHIKEEHILKQLSELCLPKDDMNLKYHIHNKGSNGNRNRITNKFFA